ncbi:probable protein phosphatase 2C 4 [Cryptomeria japonica]|uniref:probable protein phosphatase 2C 4 n=1 Tax=Cryptomeria japonica TaxID=3369 RepID=UPI0027DA2CE4|nr:probable protein phosphatase 2C 4 [Cryptomeria japonica]
MGNSVSRVVGCFMPVGNEQERVGLVFSEPLDEGLGHSFCYVRPVIESARYSPSQSERFGILETEGLEGSDHSRSFRFSQEENNNVNANNPNAKIGPETTTFKAISGASVSANTSTPRTVAAPHDHQYNNNTANQFNNPDRASAFEGTASFSSLPLQPVPRGLNSTAYSGPMSGPLVGGPVQQATADKSFMSAPLERGGGFLSGPLERAFLSGPLEGIDRSHFSAPLASHHATYFRRRRRYISRVMRTVSRPVRRAFSRTLSKTAVLPSVMQMVGWHQQAKGVSNSGNYESGMFLGFPSDDISNGNNLQWAQGKAGEDRVHVVLSEEHGWLFVGIYDGFNGPDAPEFLMCNLYKAIFNELEGLLWDRKHDCTNANEGEDCQAVQSEQQNLPSQQEESRCSHAQSGQQNPDIPRRDLHCSICQSTSQPIPNHPQNPEATKEDCPHSQSKEQADQNHSKNPGVTQEDCSHSQSVPQINPNVLQEVTQEDCLHSHSALEVNANHPQDSVATQEDCPLTQSPQKLNPHNPHSPEVTREHCPQVQLALQLNANHPHCSEAAAEDPLHTLSTVQQNPDDLEIQAAAQECSSSAQSGQWSSGDRQDADVKRAKLTVEDSIFSKSEQEKIEINDRRHPARQSDSEKPQSSNCEIGTELSGSNTKMIGKQGHPRPLTEFIKRVTFECEKEVGEHRKGRSLRELLAEEEDDPLDFFVWNSTANSVDKSRRNNIQRTENSTSGSVAPTDSSAETRESNGVSDQISDGRTRRVAYSDSEQKQSRGRSLLSSKIRQAYSKRKESHRKLFPWRYDWEKERIEVEKKIDERLKQDTQRCKAGSVNHVSVLKALSRALEVTEEAYLEMTDKFLDENPELALMGSCLLVMLMKDQDVYVMNVGDSRAIVAQQRPDTNSGATQHCSYQKGDRQDKVCLRDSLVRSELEGITEEPSADPSSAEENKTKNGPEVEMPVPGSNLIAVQLSTDHSTSIEEEVLRIKAEHPDDNQSILNDRVKGRLKVTRAFGAGFLKQPKWNNALLEMFRNDYIGTAPYISCTPSLRHHRLGANDQFLVISSDGLYQYLSNQEVVSHVELFMEKFPDGDPAQSLIEELLFRAAKKAGMDFHELLDIPQGDRRKYHDDVSVMVISLEGRIWKSSGKYI